MRAVTTVAKILAQRALGVHISRTPPVAVSKHADHAISRLRRWTSNDVVFDVGANDGRTVCVTRARPPLGWSPVELEGYRLEVLAYCDALFVKARL